MSAGSSNNTPLVLELTYDQAYEEVELLVNSSKKDTSGVTLYTGDHPKYGRIHIIIPSLGNGMMMFPGMMPPGPSIVPVFGEE